MTTIQNMQGAIFDMDGTLIDSLGVWEIIWDAFKNNLKNGEAFNITESDDKKVRTMTLKNAMEYIHSIYSVGESGKELLEAAEATTANYYTNTVRLKEGVLEFLEYCLKNNIKMCIASATDIRLLNIVIEHCNIKKYFAHIISCAETGKGKDKPDIYLKALSLLGTDKDNTWVFEDSHVAIETARGIGLKTVGIYDKYNFGFDKIMKTATLCIREGGTLKKLIKENL